MSHHNISESNPSKVKEDLANLVSKCQQRTFAEEVDFLEELGGNYIKPFKGLF